MLGVALTPAQQKELEQLKAAPIPVVYAGACAGCGRQIPVNYLYYVTRWETVRRDGLPTMKPAEIWCRDCGGGDDTAVETARRHRRRRAVPVIEREEPKPNMGAKETALKLLSVMDRNEPHGSKYLCKRARISYNQEFILAIMKKLLQAGRVEFDAGKWRKV